MNAVNDLRRARQCYAQRSWKDAHDLLTRAGEISPLGPEDLELLAISAYMLGRDDAWSAALGRAHHAYLEREEPVRAARCAFWISTTLSLQGEIAQATGWLGRAQRLLEDVERDCVERGYLLLPAMFEHEASGDYTAAAALAAEAAEIGARFDDSDLFALATHAQGQMLIKSGRVDEGLALLDEAMVAATADDLSPIVAGIVYCGVILACQEVFELRRAQEWTATLSRWCEGQSDLVAFTGRCLVHRSEIMQVRGTWQEALQEVRRAVPRLLQSNPRAAGLAFYRQGELHRLRGEFDAAEEAYREASRAGYEPQPGLALLRLAQGKTEAAVAGIRRATAEPGDPLRRAALLPASIEILLAGGETEEAERACADLETIAEEFESAMLRAIVAQARGAVQLAGGDAEAALAPLRRAWEAWHELEAPYEAARVRVLLATACGALGDEDAATLELEAAREIFARLGAAPDLTRVEAIAGRAPADRHGLSTRELEVLRLVAAGKTNREIASELVISEHTVARHVQNIFTKLRLSSRAAATAYAYEHGLV